MKRAGLLALTFAIASVWFMPVVTAQAAAAWKPRMAPAAGARRIINHDIEVIPHSSLVHPADRGRRMHTFVHMMYPRNNKPRVMAAVAAGAQGIKPATAGLPPVLGQPYNTPASLACVYGLASSAAATSGCNPDVTTEYNSGGSGLIAIVDAYHYSTAAADLAAFNTQFGLPSSSFSVVYASGSQPGVDPTGSWELEASLDIQYAHAMAPDASIVLVEADSNSTSDLLAAVNVASGLVAAAGGGQVSMSWGSNEFAGEGTYDTSFATYGVTYIASAGDSAGVSWPSASSKVISAGGTTIVRDGSNAFTGETAWNSTGGGPSSEIGIPSYQSSISGTVGTARGTPDIALVADPASGVWVYNSGYVGGPWLIVGGTSLSAPALAGIINSGGSPASVDAFLSQVYTAASNVTFADITAGTCGPASGYTSAASWDYCTGNGVPGSITTRPASSRHSGCGALRIAAAKCLNP